MENVTGGGWKGAVGGRQKTMRNLLGNSKGG